jgi:hypothetical protein
VIEDTKGVFRSSKSKKAPSKTRSVVPFSYETHVMLLKTGTVKVLSAIEEIKKSSLNGENIHCMLRN